MVTCAAACSSRLSSPSSSSIHFTPFFDQTHGDFHSCGSAPSSPCLRSVSLRCFPVILCCVASDCAAALPTLEPPSHGPSILLEELSQRYMQMKLEKREMKAQMKEEKKKVKIQMKQEKKELKAQMKEEKKKVKMQMKQKKNELKAQMKEEKKKVKMQMKQKKKELKAQMKENKKKVKTQMKQEKKTMKHKDVAEGEKKKCSSELSSSSESADHECVSLSMNILRQDCLLDRIEKPTVLNRLETSDVSVHTKAVDVIAFATCVAPCSSRLAMSGVECATEVSPAIETHGFDAPNSADSLARCNGDAATEASFQKDLRRHGLLASNAVPQCANRIEVCAGGKCKKAGSEQLLSVLRGQIPSASNVACKCMGKCSMAMNAKVHKEDTNPQHHSQVRVENANVLLSHHFGLGQPPTGLPATPSGGRPRVPLHFSASACVI